MSYDIVQEKVPGFIRRLGDHVSQGSNNTLIWQGTDRADAGPADIDTGLGTPEADGGGKGTGTIMVVAGRQDAAGNPDLDKDLAYLYVTMKSKIDDNLGLTSVEQSTKSSGEPGAIMKSDHLRLVFRKGIKIALDGGKNYIYADGSTIVLNVNGTKATIIDGKMVIDSGQIELGGSVTDPVVLGTKFMNFLNNYLTVEYAAHTHPTAVGPSGPPIQPATPMDASLLSNVTKTQ